MMNYDELTTDKLVEIIVTKIGVPLPTYNYNDYKKYITVVPKNITIGDNVKGIENADIHNTFRDGCMRIINWYNDNF